MPELPEVETIRRLTETHLVGHAVRSFDVTLPKLLRQSVIADASVLLGRTLLGAHRRGKVLDLRFDGAVHLLVHFKLSGQLAIQLPDGDRFVAGHPVPKPDGVYPHKATHANMTFDDGRYFWYSDVRQFGWFNILPEADAPAVVEALELGPEATEPVDIERLLRVFSRRSVPVKTVLLDQQVLAGLGNIYVDEVLFASGIHPATPANTLTIDQITSIAGNIMPVLAEGIRQGGARIVHGKAIPDNGFPAAHGREGEMCVRCGSMIVKSRVGSRGTYHCPGCQPER